MRKDRNKERRNLTEKQQPAEKRRKMGEGGYEESRRAWGKLGKIRLSRTAMVQEREQDMEKKFQKLQIDMQSLGREMI